MFKAMCCFDCVIFSIPRPSSATIPYVIFFILLFIVKGNDEVLPYVRVVARAQYRPLVTAVVVCKKLLPAVITMLTSKFRTGDALSHTSRVVVT